MPRQIAWKPRLIHPASATSISLSRVSALAELLFWKLIPQCDDQGRLFGNPELVKATCCPMRKELTPELIPSLLKELEQVEVIIHYSNSTTSLLQMTNWWEWESPQWAYPSSIPPPAEWKDRLRYRKGGKVVTNNWGKETLVSETDEG